MPADGLGVALGTLPPHWHGHFFEAVESTQDEARAAARLGAAHRSIFVADFQRAGRGRQGRAWLAEPGVALMMSLVFRDAAAQPAPLRWTTLASVSLVEAIEQVVPDVGPAIKWPNDVLLDDRKVAGILAETSFDAQGLQAIVGVGVNVNSGPAELAKVGGVATSLRVAAGHQVDRGQLLLAFVRSIDTWLVRSPEELTTVWQARLWGRGQRVRLREPGLAGEDEEVVVLGVDPDGSLRVRLADGTERRTSTAELIL
jgi:BirA family transcriptional regulator, biotin operon repressor / biotin---[acetyl-CoA-carboxylase] ligase